MAVFEDYGPATLECCSKMLKITPHPAWLKESLEELQPYYDSVVHHNVFGAIKNGTFTLKQFQAGLIYFYPLVESFPKYMALSLAKVPAGDSKWNRKTAHWLTRNINQERIHTRWWKHWAIGFGITAEIFDQEISPPAEMDAINDYLWRVCTHGSLIESISASNFAIEGPTGEWTRQIAGSLRLQRIDGAQINKASLEWVEGHAHYDDRHPQEALELIKALALSQEEQQAAHRAAKRSLELYALALDYCYRHFK